MLWAQWNAAAHMSGSTAANMLTSYYYKIEFVKWIFYLIRSIINYDVLISIWLIWTMIFPVQLNFF